MWIAVSCLAARAASAGQRHTHEQQRHEGNAKQFVVIAAGGDARCPWEAG